MQKQAINHLFLISAKAKPGAGAPGATVSLHPNPFPNYFGQGISLRMRLDRFSFKAGFKCTWPKPESADGKKTRSKSLIKGAYSYSGGCILHAPAALAGE